MGDGVLRDGLEAERGCEVRSEAYLSDDRQFRFWLLRIWDDSLPINCICGVNPSTADEQENDPTIRKDIGFSTRQGFGGLLKVNLSAYRSTDPRPARSHYIGNENTAAHLKTFFKRFQAKQFVAAWGKNGRYFPFEAEAILAEFPDALCFGKNSDGTPRHTLMLPYSTPLEKVRG
jgi:hypothetical protein